MSKDDLFMKVYNNEKDTENEALQMKVSKETEFSMKCNNEIESQKVMKVPNKQPNNEIRKEQKEKINSDFNKENKKVNSQKEEIRRKAELNDKSYNSSTLNKEMKNKSPKKNIPMILFCVSAIIVYFIFNSSDAKEDIKDNELYNTTQTEVTGDTEEEIEHNKVYESYISSDYIISDSNEKFLDESELYEYNKTELAYIRNEIFARRGYVFKTEAYKKYFEGKDWYIPNESIKGDFSDLNIYEESNVKLIKELEKR